MEVVKKVVVAGHFGVGKTSLIRQFIHQKFSDQYLTTIGVKIDKKLVHVDGREVKIMLWDIAGESSTFRIPKQYLAGAHGLIYVFDLTREETYVNIEKDLFELHREMKSLPSIVLGNKSDLAESSFIESLQATIPVDFRFTSAKTGVNIEDSFIDLAKEML